MPVDTDMEEGRGFIRPSTYRPPDHSSCLDSPMYVWCSNLTALFCSMVFATTLLDMTHQPPLVISVLSWLFSLSLFGIINGRIIPREYIIRWQITMSFAWLMCVGIALGLLNPSFRPNTTDGGNSTSITRWA